MSMFSNKSSQEAQKFEEIFARFKEDYANADETTKRDIVNALLGDVAGDLNDYIHRRNKPSDVVTGSVLSRAYLSVSHYFTEGKGDPEHYETGRQFVLLLKEVVSQSICARIRQYAREHGGANANIISIDGGNSAEGDAPALQIEAFKDFVADLERKELVEILGKELAAAERGESSRITPQEQKLLELRFKKEYTLERIAKFFNTNPTAISRNLANVLDRLAQMFKERGVDGV